MMRPPVDGLWAETYEIPTDRPEADATFEWSSTTVVVVRVSCGPHEGLGWTYAPEATASIIERTFASIVIGSDPAAIARTHRSMAHSCRNMGLPGVGSCALSAVDIALWDLKAKLLDLPLADLFGRVSSTVPVYGSGGFVTYSDTETRAQIRTWADDWGIPRVKIKVAESAGENLGRDVHRVRIARDVIGPSSELFVDANGGYTRKQAIRVGKTFAEDFGVTWFEEPVTSDDLEGLRLVRDHCAADVAAGEYGYTAGYFARMLAAGAVDCLQADATRCGGYTGWLDAARIADAEHVEISAHCAPNLHAPVAAAVTNLRHVEYFHDHYRIEEMLFEGTSSPDGGTLLPQGLRPGHGMRFRQEESSRYRVAPRPSEPVGSTLEHDGRASDG